MIDESTDIVDKVEELLFNQLHESDGTLKKYGASARNLCDKLKEVLDEAIRIEWYRKKNKEG